MSEHDATIDTRLATVLRQDIRVMQHELETLSKAPARIAQLQKAIAANQARLDLLDPPKAKSAAPVDPSSFLKRPADPTAAPAPGTPSAPV